MEPVAIAIISIAVIAFVVVSLMGLAYTYRDRMKESLRGYVLTDEEKGQQVTAPRGPQNVYGSNMAEMGRSFSLSQNYPEDFQPGEFPPDALPGVHQHYPNPEYDQEQAMQDPYGPQDQQVRRKSKKQKRKVRKDLDQMERAETTDDDVGSPAKEEQWRSMPEYEEHEEPADTEEDAVIQKNPHSRKPDRKRKSKEIEDQDLEIEGDVEEQVSLASSKSSKSAKGGRSTDKKPRSRSRNLYDNYYDEEDERSDKKSRKSRKPRSSSRSRKSKSRSSESGRKNKYEPREVLDIVAVRKAREEVSDPEVSDKTPRQKKHTKDLPPKNSDKKVAKKASKNYHEEEPEDEEEEAEEEKKTKVKKVEKRGTKAQDDLFVEPKKKTKTKETGVEEVEETRKNASKKKIKEDDEEEEDTEESPDKKPKKQKTKKVPERDSLPVGEDEADSGEIEQAEEQTKPKASAEAAKKKPKQAKTSKSSKSSKQSKSASKTPKKIKSAAKAAKAAAKKDQDADSVEKQDSDEKPKPPAAENIGDPDQKATARSVEPPKAAKAPPRPPKRPPKGNSDEKQELSDSPVKEKPHRKEPKGNELVREFVGAQLYASQPPTTASSDSPELAAPPPDVPRRLAFPRAAPPLVSGPVHNFPDEPAVRPANIPPRPGVDDRKYDNRVGPHEHPSRLPPELLAMPPPRRTPSKSPRGGARRRI